MRRDFPVLHLPSGEYPIFMGWGRTGHAWVWFRLDSEMTEVPIGDLEES